jgi:preprotein translocase subunit SecY
VGIHALLGRVAERSTEGPGLPGPFLFAPRSDSERLRLPAHLTQLLRLVGSRRLIATGLCLVAWRVLEQITVSGVNQDFVAIRLQSLDTSSGLNAIGNSTPVAPYSVVALSITPYINALVVMTVIRALSGHVRNRGESPEGRLQLRRWTRALAVGFALGQAYSWTVLMQSGSALPSQMEWFPRLVVVLELTAGTMILVLLADVIDEFGLGFGYGAILIYVLSPVAGEVHRLALTIALAPSVEALYRPIGVWAAFSIGVVAITVAVLLAVRPVAPRKTKKPSSEKPAELTLLMSGVLRPPAFAQAVLFLPVILSNYLGASNQGASRWLTLNWTAYGLNPWTDAAYAATYVCLVIGFTYLVIALDFRGTRMPPYLAAHINRLTLVGGTFLALIVVVLPILERIASRAAGTVIAMSGYDAVLVAATILAIIGSLERRTTTSVALPAPISGLP